MSCEPVRRQALEILLAVAEGERLDPLLDRALAAASDPRAAGFLAELVRGTLQWQGRYDYVITSFSRKRPPSDPVLVGILRLALHQLLGLDGVPAYAAIHQAGELCRLKAGRGKVGFINGMLQAVRRQVLGEKADPVYRDKQLRGLFHDFENDRPRWLAAWYSLPPWLVTRWVHHFGPDGAAALCVWTNQPAPLHLHVLAPVSVTATQQLLETAGLTTTITAADVGTLQASARPPRKLLRGCLESVPGLIVQDASVQEATHWLASDLPAGGRLWDMCAAPGGKTVHMQALNPTASVVAMDNRRHRMQLLADTLQRVALGRVVCVQGNGDNPPFAPGTFDGILLDGPCSGTGVLRHHPDGRWRLQPGTPEHNGEQLLRLARRAVEMLAPGGRLMYATCSLEPAENDQVLTRLLAACPTLAPAPDAEGRWRRYWLPHESSAAGAQSGDGFFAARMCVRS